jgi:hypothetical protein
LYTALQNFPYSKTNHSQGGRIASCRYATTGKHLETMKGILCVDTAIEYRYVKADVLICEEANDRPAAGVDPKL